MERKSNKKILFLYLLTAAITLILTILVYNFFILPKEQEQAYSEGYKKNEIEIWKKAQGNFNKRLADLIKDFKLKDTTQVLRLPYVKSPNFSYFKTVNTIVNYDGAGENEFSIFQTTISDIHNELFFSVSNQLALDSMNRSSLMRKVDSITKSASLSYYERYNEKIKQLRKEEKLSLSEKAKAINNIIKGEICRFTATMIEIAEPMAGLTAHFNCDFVFGDFQDNLDKYNKITAAAFDLLNSEASLSNQIKQNILELATAQSVYKIYHEASFTDKTFWGDRERKYHFIMSGRVKVLFPLHKYFDLKLDVNNRKISVTLPQPELEVSEYQVEKIFEKDDEIDLRKETIAIEEAKIALINEARNSYLSQYGKYNAIQALENIFSILSQNGAFEISVSFADQPNYEILNFQTRTRTLQ